MTTKSVSYRDVLFALTAVTTALCFIGPDSALFFHSLSSGVGSSGVFFVHLLDMLLVLLLVAAGATLFKTRKAHVPPRWLLWGLGLLVCGYFLAAAAEKEIVALAGAWRVLCISGVSLCIAVGVLPRAAVLWGFAFGGVALAATALMQAVAQAPLGLGFLGEPFFSADAFSVAKVATEHGVWLRPPALAPHANVAALGMLAGLVAVIALQIKKTFLPIALLAAGIVCTLSRSVWVAVGVLLVLVWQSLPRHMLGTLVAGGAAGVVAGAFISPVFNRVHTAAEAVAHRMAGLPEAALEIINNPLGYGAHGLIPNLIHKEAIELSHTVEPVHNAIMYIALEGGVVAAVGFVVLLALGAICCYRKSPILAAGLMAYLVAAQMDHAMVSHADVFATAVLLAGAAVHLPTPKETLHS